MTSTITANDQHCATSEGTDLSLLICIIITSDLQVYRTTDPHPPLSILHICPASSSHCSSHSSLSHAVLIFTVVHIFFFFLVKAQKVGMYCIVSDEERIVQHGNPCCYASVWVLWTLGPQQMAHTLIHHHVFTLPVRKQREAVDEDMKLP